MGAKEHIANSYIEKMKLQHSGKELRPFRRILVTGSDRTGNIGSVIAEQLYMMHAHWMVDELMFGESDFDVRHPSTYPSNLAQYDTLIMSHGYTRLDWIEDARWDDIRVTVDTNLTGSIILTSEFVRATLTADYRKQVIIIGSMAYNHVLNASAAYCASKAGLAHFVRCAAWELAPKGYDVFGIHPSNTLGTPMTEETIAGIMRVRDCTREEAEAYWGAVLPRARWLRPLDIAHVVSFLVSGAGEYMSGANIELGGGQR